MRILVLQQPASFAPVERWLLEALPAAQVRLLSGTTSTREGRDLDPRASRRTVEDYAGEPGTRALHEEVRSWGPDVVLSNSEGDVLRVAEARAAYGVPGTGPEVARLFRDKLAMKELFERAGLDAPRACSADDAEQARALLAATGRVVVKPRSGVGSAAVSVHTGPEGLARVLAREEGPRLCEEYVSGPVLHCDATVQDRRLVTVSVSRYLRSPHRFGRHNVASVSLADASRSARDLRAAAQRLVDALPEGHGVTAMHLEVFDAGERGLLAGEVACRVGGGMIKDVVSLERGVDLTREAYALACGVPPDQRSRDQRTHAGFILFTATPAPRLSPSPSWVHAAWHEQRGQEARNSTDATGGLVATGSSPRSVARRLRWCEAA